VRSSGFGKEMGMEGVLEFTELKTIQIRTGRRPPFFQAPDAQTL
jgi:acyl-CoA reductase-like NAD-dependent aldehyde dehydrogenase